MLSPSNRIVLLPQDREIMDITGMSEEEYRWFVRECYKNTKLRPGEPVALDPGTIGLILTVVGILLQVAGALLAPKPKDQESKTPEEETIEGQNVVRRDRFAPKSGFDSFQNVVDMGSVVPIIYCKREDIGGITYGGLRVNTNLLWSQVLSVGGGQFFRGIFLVGEAPVNLERRQIALGNNTLASYELQRFAEAGRISVYFKNGGRIDEDDIDLGVKPDNDPGAFDPDDIYEVDNDTNFCQALQPSNQVEFGVYGHIGNNFGYKLGEPFTATSQWQQGDTQLTRQASDQKYAEAVKSSIRFTTRAGFVAINNQFVTGPQAVSEDQVLDYRIFSSSEYERAFVYDETQEKTAILNSRDVATAIASIQRTYDERINVGSLYKAGSATLICISRNDPFVSEIEFDNGEGANTVVARFRVIKGGDGVVDFYSTGKGVGQLQYDAGNDNATNADEGYNQGRDSDINGTLCSESSQLFQLLVASFSVERACKTIEVGLQSNVGLKSSGITNFNSLVTEELYSGYERILNGSYLAYVDAEFCGGADDGKSGDYRKEILPGTYSAADTRYSFFRILYRDIDSSSPDFIASTNLYGIRSVTGVDVYNFIRLKFNTNKRREFRFVPISSWEIRSNQATGALYAIDAHSETDQSIYERQDLTDEDKRFTVEFVGEKITNRAEAFSVKAFKPPEVRALEVCKNRDAITDVTVANQGSGYALGGDTKEYQNIQMVSLSNSSRRFRCDVVVKKSDSDPGGYVQSVSLPSGAPPDKNGFSTGDEFKCLSDNDIGGGSGFRGRVTVDEVTECEDKDTELQLGISPVDDGDSYVDSYARIAEAFIYEGITTTASEPEHRISYVNIISENLDSSQDPPVAYTPEYDNLAIVGLNIRSSKELRSLDQLSVYVEEGVIDSHLFPDVFEDLLTNPRYGTGQFFDAAQIDTDSFAAAADWTYDRRYFFDGAISEKINLRSWGAERARDFLLDLSISGGKFTLNPTVRFDEPEPVVAMFSSGNIIEDTLQVNYFDSQDRLDPIVSVRWREERRDSSVDSKGLFPQIREFNVRRKGVDENAPVIQVDLSSFCTNRKHAEDRAKLECQSKRYITHAVSFKTVPSETGVQAGSIIKLGIETVYYNQPQNGAISNTGEVTAWPALTDGSHPVILWDGNELRETTIEVIGGKATDNANSVFCIRDSSQKAETYKVSSVSFDEDGNVDIEALYWPTGDDGISLLTVDWDSPGEWEIDG